MAHSRWEEDHNIWRLSGPTSEQPSPPMPFIASTRDDREPQYSPDGSRIAFASDRSGNREVWICDSDGSNPFQLTFLGHSMGHDWSADQRRITFHAVERANDPSGGKLGEIFIVDAHGGIPRNITHDEFGDGHPSWSADERWIDFNSRRTGDWQVWKISVDEGRAIQLTRKGGLKPTATDEGVVFYSCGTKVCSVSCEGGEEEIVLDRDVLVWCLWRSQIVFVEDQPQTGVGFYQFDRATKKTTRLYDLGVANRSFSGITVSPDGSCILYSQRDRRSGDIFLVENFDWRQ